MKIRLFVMLSSLLLFLSCGHVHEDHTIGDDLVNFYGNYPVIVWFLLLFVGCQTIIILAVSKKLRLELDYPILTYTSLIILFYWITDSFWSMTSHDWNLAHLMEWKPTTFWTAFLLQIPPYQIGSRIVTTVAFLTIGILISRYLKTLNESETRYSDLFKNMRTPIAFHKIMRDGNGVAYDFTYIRVNETFCEVMKMPEKDIIGKSCTEIIDISKMQPDAYELVEIFGDIAANGGSKTMEMYLGHLQKWYIATIYSESKDYFVIIFYDISDRKKYEASVKTLLQHGSSKFGEEYLTEISYRLSQTLQADYVAIGELEKSSTIVSLLSAYGPEGKIENFKYNLAQSPCEQLLQKKDCVILDNVDIDYPDNELLSSRGIKGYVGVPFFGIDGSIIGVMVALFKENILHPDYNIEILKVFSSRVASELERLRNDEIRRKLDSKIRHVQKMEAIGTLSGGLAHDFNNILTCILGNIELVKLETDHTWKHWKNILSVEKSVFDGSNLTKQLLGFARGGKYVTQSIDMNKLISTVLDSLVRTNKKACFKQSYGEVPFINGDKNQMKRILLNLILNAIDAIEEGGTIEVTTELKKFSKEDILKYDYEVKPGYYVCISVCDDGMGMSQEVQQKAFEPFFTTKSMGLGTGLGLATVFGIIKNHAGMISIYSEVGMGTTIRFCIPKSNSVKIDYNKKIGKKKVHKGTGTILIVDDEKTILNISREFLERLGYRIFCADRGEDAINLYYENVEDIDMVILDLIMPAVGGSKVLDALKLINPNVKVLLSSGYSKDGYADKVMKKGCKDFIQKPFTFAELSEKIKDVMET